MSLLRDLLEKQSAVSDIQAKARAAADVALAKYGEEYGEEARAQLKEELYGSNEDARAEALSVLVDLAPDLPKIAEDYASASAATTALLEDVRREATDRLDVLHRVVPDLDLAVPASEREEAGLRDAALGVIHEDKDQGIGRYVLGRLDALPPDSPLWNSALKFAAEQSPPEDPHASKSIEELEADLAAMHGTSPEARTASGVLAVNAAIPTTVIDSLQEEIDRGERPPKGDPDELARGVHSERRRNR